jgi:hypothetical protein
LVLIGRIVENDQDAILIVRAAEDLERIRTLFADLETKTDVIDLLHRAETGDGVKIFIGSENKLFSLSGSSMIAAPLRDGDHRIAGVLGVIGPTRLNNVDPIADALKRRAVMRRCAAFRWEAAQIGCWVSPSLRLFGRRLDQLGDDCGLRHVDGVAALHLDRGAARRACLNFEASAESSVRLAPSSSMDVNTASDLP